MATRAREQLRTMPEAFAANVIQAAEQQVMSAQNRKVVVNWGQASDPEVLARAMYEVMTTDIRPDLPRIRTPSNRRPSCRRRR